MKWPIKGKLISNYFDTKERKCSEVPITEKYDLEKTFSILSTKTTLMGPTL